VKKLDKFVLKSFIGPLILTFFIVLIILILQFLWMYVDELAGKGLEIKVVGELLFQFSLSFVPMALPLAILLASLMTFGNMGEFS
jgi:lipopolysaccharide export system permease protein